ncbi:MAG: DEAD/DEAH box helicase [Lentisphaerota bacterium]
MSTKSFDPNVFQEKEKSEIDFSGLGIAPKILEILAQINFKVPTPIQLKAIPIATSGKDVIGVAQTGTGKTHSFAIPMVQILSEGKGTGLVLAPTRELAIQINEAFQDIARPFGIKTVCLIGGANMMKQTQNLKRGPRIVIATPGRLIDHIRRRNYRGDTVQMLVLDEADMMLDMGFAPQINQILTALPKDRQTMLFSATIPKAIMELATTYMRLPVSVEVAPSGTTVERVTQELFIVHKDAKLPLLGKLLAEYQGSVLLFSRTRHNARKLTKSIYDMGYDAAEIHSNRSLTQRREALDGFKAGKYKVLVATDIAARGIDVSGIELVINFDLPEDPENYVHRIGRTARAGCPGHAISFATPDQSRDVWNIERLIRLMLPVSKHPEIAAEEFRGQKPKQQQPSGRSSRNSKPTRFSRRSNSR